MIRRFTKIFKYFLIAITVFSLIIAIYVFAKPETYSFWDIEYMPDGKIIASVSGWPPIGSPTLWDWQKDKQFPLPIFPEKRFYPGFLSISPDGNYLAVSTFGDGQMTTCHGEKFVALYNIGERKIVFSHSGYSPCFSPDGRKLVFTDKYDKDNNKEILIFNIDNQNIEGRIKMPKPCDDIYEDFLLLTSTSNSKGIPLVVSRLSNSYYTLGIVEVLNWHGIFAKLKHQETPGTKKILELMGKEGKNAISNWNYDLTIGEDSRRVVLKEFNRIIRKENLSAYEEFKDIVFPRKKNLIKDAKNGLLSAQRELNRRILQSIFTDEIADLNSTVLGVWDITKLKCVMKLHIKNTGKFVSMFAAGGKIFLLKQDEESALIKIDMKENRIRKTNLDKNILFGELSIDGKLLAFLCQDYKTLVIWDVNRNEEVRQINLPPTKTAIMSMTFSSDNKFLAVGTQFSTPYSGELYIYDLGNGKLVKVIKPGFDFGRAKIQKTIAGIMSQ